jgi:hypothetical protein
MNPYFFLMYPSVHPLRFWQKPYYYQSNAADNAIPPISHRLPLSLRGKPACFLGDSRLLCRAFFASSSLAV